jgi:hypothetical protein
LGRRSNNGSSKVIDSITIFRRRRSFSKKNGFFARSKGARFIDLTKIVIVRRDIGVHGWSRKVIRLLRSCKSWLLFATISEKNWSILYRKILWGRHGKRDVLFLHGGGSFYMYLDRAVVEFRPLRRLVLILRSFHVEKMTLPLHFLR